MSVSLGFVCVFVYVSSGCVCVSHQGCVLCDSLFGAWKVMPFGGDLAGIFADI